MGRPELLGLWILGKKVNTRSSGSGDGEIFGSGRQFLFSNKIVNRIFDNVLLDQSEIFVHFSIKGGVRRLPQGFFLVEVGPPNNNCAAFVGRFNDYVFAFF